MKAKHPVFKQPLPLCVALAVVTALPVHIGHAQTSVPDACAVISSAEVTTILGRKDFGTPRSEKGPEPGESICRFPGRGQFTNEGGVSEKIKQDLLALARAVMTKLQG